MKELSREMQWEEKRPTFMPTPAREWNVESFSDEPRRLNSFPRLPFDTQPPPQASGEVDGLYALESSLIQVCLSTRMPYMPT